jgi:hypothetical protein
MHMPTLDHDLDGRDDVLSLFSAQFAIHDGDTGNLLVERWTWQFCDDQWIFTKPFLEHGLGVVADFMGNGGEQVLFGKNKETLAVLDFDANVLWHTTPFDSGLNSLSLQGVGDIDGDGDLEIISVGHSNPGAEIVVYDGATSTERWSLALSDRRCDDPDFQRLSHVATGDIDGDGKDEALFNDCNFLYAIGEKSPVEGEFLWRVTFPDNQYNADLGDVVIADVDGSGRPQIIVNTASGYIYGLGYPGEFKDAPLDYWAFEFIESLARAGITAGCGNGNYCPEDPVTRAQMAVFLERGMRSAEFSPPAATGTVFDDVGANDFAAAFIEQFFADGITSGCGGGNYCPNASVTRAQMAVFLLRAKHGAAYVPPAATGVFADVPVGSFADSWIEQLALEGITSGCGGGNYCPNDPVTRAQMAVFLVRAFGL